MAKNNDLLDLYSLEDEPINDNFMDYSCTITGAGGVGKSTFTHALYRRLCPTATFACEDRFKGIKGIKVVMIDSFNTALKYEKMIRVGLKERGELPFKALIIDPIGEFGKMVEKYILDENNAVEMKDVAFGGAYNQFEDAIDGFVSRLRKMGVVVSFVAHGKSETVNPPLQDSYEVQNPDTQKRLKYMVLNEVDFLMYLSLVREKDSSGKSVTKRRLYLHGFPEFALKVPLDGFPEYIEWTGEVQEGVELFLAAFDRAVEFTKNKKSIGESINPIISSVPVKDKKKAKDHASVDVVEKDVELEALVKEAIANRDNLVKTIGRDSTIDVMLKILGTVKMSEALDKDKLREFINFVE